MIVDEAHGAHLGFHPHLPPSALQQGADLVIQSTHKVLSSLSQSSMLHISQSSNLVDRERICKSLQTLQTTSPSYLLLASLDAATAQLTENPKTIFSKALELSAELRHLMKQIPGVSVLECQRFSSFPAVDPLRITVIVWKLGLSGYEANEILSRDYGVICELVDTRSVTFVINLGTCRDDAQRLVSAMEDLSDTFSQSHGGEKRMEISSNCLPFVDSKICLSPRQAFFARKKKVNIRESLGEICGELICPFPPGIPVMIPGEIVTENVLDYLLQVKTEGAVISGASDPLLSSMIVCNV